MASTLATQPNVQPIYDYSIQIDTAPTETTPTWAAVCAGIKNLSEALNENVEQMFFLCGKGFADNEVTGMAPAITLTGTRVNGDTAQDYIFAFAQKYGLYTARHSHLLLTRTDNSTTTPTTTIVSANITICNIQEISGDANKPSDISFELRINGVPVSGNAWQD
jgi:hypothetical protein